MHCVFKGVGLITNSLILLGFSGKIIGYKGDLSLCICIKFMLITSTISEIQGHSNVFFVIVTLKLVVWCYTD